MTNFSSPSVPLLRSAKAEAEEGILINVTLCPLLDGDDGGGSIPRTCAADVFYGVPGGFDFGGVENAIRIFVVLGFVWPRIKPFQVQRAGLT